MTTWTLSAATEEGTGRGGLQLQLPGSGPPPSLLLLLAAPREGLHPLHLVQESQRPLREARPPGAAAQRQPGRRLRVGEETSPPSLPRNAVSRLPSEGSTVPTGGATILKFSSPTAGTVINHVNIMPRCTYDLKILPPPPNLTVMNLAPLRATRRLSVAIRFIHHHAGANGVEPSEAAGGSNLLLHFVSSNTPPEEGRFPAGFLDPLVGHRVAETELSCKIFNRRSK